MSESAHPDYGSEEVLEENLARILKSALAVGARRMSEDQIGQVVRKATTRIRPAVEFPFWVLAASAACLVGLLALGWSFSGEASLLRWFAATALAANLGLSPVAALVVVRNRRLCDGR